MEAPNDKKLELDQLRPLFGKSEPDTPSLSATVLNASALQISHVPREISLLTSLTQLDLGQNAIQILPKEIGLLTSLKTLNLMCNSLEELPTEIGNLVNLETLGLKSNKLTSLPPSIGNLTKLVNLFLTDNLLTTLPDEIGNLASLRKFQLAENRLVSLPPTIQKMSSLELFRMAGNCLASVPIELARIPRLAWLTLSNNPLCPQRPNDLPHVDCSDLELSERPLGAGASGVVHRATWSGKEVAVKLFKGDVSPDGRCEDELAVSAVIQHPNVTRVFALVGPGNKGMIMDFIGGSKPLADRPNFQSVLRCRYPPDTTYSLSFVKNVAVDIASACAYLHENGICHGDVYAHNVLVTEEGRAILCDFGAAFFYPTTQALYEKMEVRAFGLMLKDLLDRCAEREGSPLFEVTSTICAKCLDEDPSMRLCFSDIVKELSA